MDRARVNIDDFFTYNLKNMWKSTIEPKSTAWKVKTLSIKQLQLSKVEKI
jgi:hypothetical protein